MKKTVDMITQISEKTQITGNIVLENDIRIAGHIKGNVKTTQDIVLHQGGHMEGDLDGVSVTIAGVVHGNIIASQKVVLEASAQLDGDINAKILRIEEGAVFHGSCKTDQAIPSKKKDIA